MADQKYIDILKTLSSEAQVLLLSGQIGIHAQVLGEKYGLSDEQSLQLEDLIIDAITGEIDREDLAPKIEVSLDLDRETSRKLDAEIDTIIFVPLDTSDAVEAVVEQSEGSVQDSSQHSQQVQKRIATLAKESSKQSSAVLWGHIRNTSKEQMLNARARYSKAHKAKNQQGESTRADLLMKGLSNATSSESTHFFSLPHAIQMYLLSGEVQAHAQLIGESNALNSHDSLKLEDILVSVLMGEVHPKHFIGKIQELGLPKEKALSLARDINKKVFGHVKAELIEVHHIGDARAQKQVVGDIASQTETPKPATQEMAAGTPSTNAPVSDKKNLPTEVLEETEEKPTKPERPTPPPPPKPPKPPMPKPDKSASYTPEEKKPATPPPAPSKKNKNVADPYREPIN